MCVNDTNFSKKYRELMKLAPSDSTAFHTNMADLLRKKCFFAHFILTDSSSFSMPLGIWGTALLIAEYSGRSGNSSAR